MKKIFVTGISGHLGVNLVRQLLEEGYIVKGLIRDNLKWKGECNTNLQLIVGGLFDDFSNILSDIDYVIHCAAVTCHKLIDYADYWQINTNATIQLYHSAARCNVKKFIFVSTANTVGYGSEENPGTESDAVKEPFKDSLYARSKIMAEDYLLGHKSKMETIIVNPTFILGAYGTTSGSGKIIRMCWRKKVVFYPPGSKNYVHAIDVAAGIIKSIQYGHDGEKYLLAGENLSYRDFFRKVIAINRQKTILIPLSERVLILIGKFGDTLRKLGIRTSLCQVNMKILCTKNFYSNQKSVNELGMVYHSVDQAIIDTIKYFKSKI